MNRTAIMLTALACSALLLDGCGASVNIPVRVAKRKAETDTATRSAAARSDKEVEKSAPLQAPPRKPKLKKVEDDNFSPEYMYPESTGKKRKRSSSSSDAQNRKEDSATPKATPTPASVTKEECIALIGETKYDRYVEMLGSEAAALKRCTLLKAID
jgi:hypothetical protein